MTHFLEHLLNPRSIAFLGASNNLLTMGTGQLYTLKARFNGSIYPVHPTEHKVLGLTAYRNLEDLPEVPDLIIIVLPTRLVTEYLERAGRFGIPYAVIVSAGFSEVGNSKEQEKLNEIAQKYNMRFIGPNCIGIINMHCNGCIINCTWFPFELPVGINGNIALVSQSGSWISQILIYAERRGLRIGKAISVGNEANISLTDCLEYFIDDPDIKVIGIYIEGVKKEGRRFIKILKRLTQLKPVILIYAGGTISGSRAGMSHTASLGGKPTVYETIFQHCGVIRAETMEELYEFSHAFSLAYPPKGNRIGLITNSGGPAVALADSCEKNNLEVPLFSEPLKEKLKSIIPSVASPNNPIDLTFDLNISLFYQEIPKIVWEAGEVDALIFYGIYGAIALERSLKFTNYEFSEIFPLEAMDIVMTEALTTFADWVHENQIPVLMSCIDTGDDVVNFLQERGIPVFKWPSLTVKAMKALVTYYSNKKENN
ncbi:acetate--CoA ligase family protein [Candidatus Hodarchaeum mangrovi]